jgi:demethylmenaquinone methyltransferase/2-methoxy-6-polyprenyl-1,4-benzoquinol methylase
MTSPKVIPDPGVSGPAPGAAWTDRELTDPHARADKPQRVRRMFAAIAQSYDLNNRVHSLGRDQAWRRYAVRKAGVLAGETVLDVACGTGDLTQAFAAGAAGRVVGLDFTREMLDVARQKQRGLAEGVGKKIEYVEGDAQNLPLADSSVDVVSIAFGIRNVADPAVAVREFARVLRPGGRLVILEFDRPGFAPLRWFNDVYCGWVMPRTATMISGDKSGAYKYLPRSVGTFMSRRELCGLIAGSGFEWVRSRGLSLGICVCYSAVRRADNRGSGAR